MVRLVRSKDDAAAARLDGIERRLAALESAMPPKPRPTDRAVFERASRAPGLTPAEVEFLTQVRTRELGSLSAETRLDLEDIAARAPETAPVVPIDELLAAASSSKHLSEREHDEIRQARQYRVRGEVPGFMVRRLERIIALRAS